MDFSISKPSKTMDALRQLLDGILQNRVTALKNHAQRWLDAEDAHRSITPWVTRKEEQKLRAKAEEALAKLLAKQKDRPGIIPKRGKPLTWDRVLEYGKCGVLIWMNVRYEDPYDQKAKGYNGPCLLEPCGSGGAFYTPDGGDIDPAVWDGGDIAEEEQDGQTISFFELTWRKSWK